MFENPFSFPGKWYKANLHAHTTESDGDITPVDCATLYRQLGYDILAITDHRSVTDPPAHDGMLLIPGAEYHAGASAQGTHYHIVGLSLSSRGQTSYRPEDGAQAIIDLIHADGGEAFVAHPYWSGLMAADITPLRDCFAVEVYNTGCDIEILRGYSMVQWDDLLTLGWYCGAVAVDDGHRHKFDHGGAWTMIKAEELSIPAVMAALRNGRYYSSIGPEIKDIQVMEDKIHIATSPVVSIAMVSTPGMGGRLQATAEELLTKAEFPRPQASYCRVEICDAQGQSAWSNPFLRG